MMGVWFLSVSLGNKLAGWVAGFYQDDAGTLFRLYGTLGLIVLAGAALLALMTVLFADSLSDANKELSRRSSEQLNVNNSY